MRSIIFTLFFGAGQGIKVIMDGALQHDLEEEASQLRNAVRSDDVDAVRNLLSTMSPEALNLPNGYGVTALSSAAENRQPDISAAMVELLIGKLSPRQLGHGNLLGETAMKRATFKKNYSSARMLAQAMLPEDIGNDRNSIGSVLEILLLHRSHDNRVPKTADLFNAIASRTTLQDLLSAFQLTYHRHRRQYRVDVEHLYQIALARFGPARIREQLLCEDEDVRAAALALEKLHGCATNVMLASKSALESKFDPLGIGIFDKIVDHVSIGGLQTHLEKQRGESIDNTTDHVLRQAPIEEAESTESAHQLTNNQIVHHEDDCCACKFM